MTVLLVTATGTDIGKTFVATGLIRSWRAAGRAVEAIKPVLSGFDDTNAHASDAALLLHALGRAPTPEAIAQVSPWRFAAPLSPDWAARREGRAIVFSELVEFCRRVMAARRGTLLIEGIGGVMVPLGEHRTVLDLMATLRCPVLLVTGSYVGTLSHTFTALEVLARRNLDITAIAVSESAASAASLAETVEAIARFADAIPIIGIPRLPAGEIDSPAFERLGAALT